MLGSLACFGLAGDKTGKRANAKAKKQSPVPPAADDMGEAPTTTANEEKPPAPSGGERKRRKGAARRSGSDSAPPTRGTATFNPNDYMLAVLTLYANYAGIMC
ncbi:hypothetical protein E2562_021319 [Oryza meyeriana var. granulata]|uniref:Uncharacterized protein n=1 Tax=Oryza meyeriana var. granulata TaxID=110450 RepID=A0A6G1BY19_9ORYZ|nr:hypothetical protein E2562_021319 [Oryza meyeriana var. granulata]